MLCINAIFCVFKISISNIICLKCIYLIDKKDLFAIRMILNLFTILMEDTCSFM